MLERRDSGTGYESSHPPSNQSRRLNFLPPPARNPKGQRNILEWGLWWLKGLKQSYFISYLISDLPLKLVKSGRKHWGSRWASTDMTPTLFFSFCLSREMMLKNAVRLFSFWSLQLVHGQISQRGTQKAWRQQRFVLCAVKSTYRATAIIFVVRRTWGCFGCSVEAEGMLGAVSRHSLRSVGRVAEWFHFKISNCSSHQPTTRKQMYDSAGSFLYFGKRGIRYKKTLLDIITS